jgi:dTDP-4-amino-4,6-dideoxygalactose transaminase
LHFGIGLGDEVIVPAQTHTATAHAVEWVGARPVFVDCDPTTGNLTAEGIERALSDRTRAISVVHFAGIPCNMPAIMKIASERGLRVIEDCAIAIGARYQSKHVGLFGDAGCFSFYPVKHITTGEGGMFVTRHPEVAEAVARLRAFGVDRTHTERAIPGMYDVPTLGLNYRMGEMQAALGRTQVRKLTEILQRRRANFEVLREMLGDISGIRILDSTDRDAENSHYCFVAVIEGEAGARRDEVVARLNAAGVGTSIYYPQPVPRMTYYRNKYGYSPENYPKAAEISDSSIALPVGPHLEVEDVTYIARVFRSVVTEVCK